MTFLFILLGGLGGLVLGSAVDRSLTALGFLVGIALGAVLARLHALAARVEELRRKVAWLARDQQGGASPAAATPASAPAAVAAKPAPMAPPAAATPSGSTPAPTAPAWRAPDWEPATRAAEEPVPSTETPLLEKALDAVKRWFTDGNVPVKVGVLVLFAGVGALLRYAQRQGWLRLPIGMRLAGLALAAIAALLFGWHERRRRRAFALAVQGGAIGVLLMTVFGAFRLYHLLPAGIAFALMLMLVAATCWLALLQDSIALAVLAILAGFAAPILTSTGQGSHIALFSYYALFNLAIFGLAWRRSWRLLNLLGFAFTFLIGIAWGVLRYEPRQFATHEAFLILFFAIYVAIPIINGLRQQPARRDPVDGTLVFGNPLLSFGLQTGLLEATPMPLAWSALALAMLYGLLGWWLLRRVRVLGESFVALAVVFATLAVPLALSAWATACVFALEGAALLWLGLRQQQRLQRWSGLALQALAALAYLYSMFNGPLETVAVLNGSCLGALLIATAGFASAWLLLRHGQAHSLLLYCWGLAWWCGGAWREIERFVPPALHAPAALAFLALTALLAALAWRGTRKPALAWTTAIALGLGVLQVAGYLSAGLRPWEPWPLAALGAYALGGFAALSLLRTAPVASLGIAHSGWVWTWTVALALAAWRLSTDLAWSDGWRDALILLPLAVAWALAVLRPRWLAPPLGARFDDWRMALCTSQAVIAGAQLLVTLFSPGNTRPWPWLPLLNPLEATQLALLLIAARWLAGPAPVELAARRGMLLTIAGLLFITAATLRGVHQLGGLPWDASLWSSMLAQTSLTIVWSVLGVVGWVAGSRRGSRALWVAGAVLMGVVLAKLLLVDRAHLGSVLGIVSFIAYGLLCTIIGYLAPAPPRHAVAAER
jgi:uncharacterized membrane protein